MRTPLIRTAVVSVLALVLAACADGGGSSPPAPAEDGGATVDPSVTDTTTGPREPIVATSTGCEDGSFYWQQSSCDPARSIPLDEVISGGPPPDGIPPIDAPVYESIDDASQWLQDNSPVMVVDVNDDVRAYPLAILTWHEIVNDVIGDVPLVVTYCPLCNSALVFERTVEGPDGDMVLDFGTSGRLHKSNLVMYDRQTLNLWTQFEGEAVIGEPFLGTRMTRVPAWLFGFGQLAELHPDAQVLSRDTGHVRDYGRNPYVAYDDPDNNPFLFLDDVDDRFAPMTRLVGIDHEDGAAAVLLDVLRDQRAVDIQIGSAPLVVLWAPGQASALDTASIDAGRDVGQTAAFVAELDGDPVELAPGDTPTTFVDTRSGSTFDLRGRALDGPLEGLQLDAIPHDDSFWFVWVAFRPDTRVVTS